MHNPNSATADFVRAYMINEQQEAGYTQTLISRGGQREKRDAHGNRIPADAAGKSAAETGQPIVYQTKPNGDGTRTPVLDKDNQPIPVWVLNVNQYTGQIRTEDSASLMRTLVCTRNDVIQAEIASICKETAFVFPTTEEFFTKDLDPSIRQAMLDNVAQIIRFAIEPESDLQIRQDDKVPTEWRLQMFPVSRTEMKINAILAAGQAAGIA